MAKHTPGPWAVEIALLVAHRLPDGTAQRVCECTMGKEAEANARLIAAAPDLLDACREAAGVFHSLVSEEVWYASSQPAELLRKLEAAVKKAEG